MSNSIYPAALAVVPFLHAHFVRHVEAAIARGENVLLPPAQSDIEAVITAAFWASLNQEEGHPTRMSLAFVPPQEDAVRFERPLPCDPATLARAAPAVERPGIHLGVWREAASLTVWGATRTIPPFSLVLEVTAAGLLVAKHQRSGDAGKFVNVAVLQGDQVKLIDDEGSGLPDCPPLVRSLRGFESSASWSASVNVLVEIATSMRAHGRGGLLLVVPHGSDAWRESTVLPIPYALRTSFAGIGSLLLEAEPTRQTGGWRDAFARAVAVVAGVTAVDGATIINDRYDLLAFGAKIVRRRASQPVEHVTVTEPIVGNKPVAVPASQLGGTRHLAAAQFVQNQNDSIALVASQDGPFTVFAWSPCENTVHAHRVETLLL